MTDGFLKPIFAREDPVAYVPVSLRLADFYVPFVSDAGSLADQREPGGITCCPPFGIPAIPKRR
jgi:hypothetical protein